MLICSDAKFQHFCLLVISYCSTFSGQFSQRQFIVLEQVLEENQKDNWLIEENVPYVRLMILVAN